jgi:hypothetical protein
MFFTTKTIGHEWGPYQMIGWISNYFRTHMDSYFFGTKGKTIYIHIYIYNMYIYDLISSWLYIYIYIYIGKWRPIHLKMEHLRELTEENQRNRWTIEHTLLVGWYKAFYSPVFLVVYHEIIHARDSHSYVPTSTMGGNRGILWLTRISWWCNSV